MQLGFATRSTMALYENGGFRHVKLHGVPPAFVDAIAQVPLLIPKPGQPLDEMVRTKRIVHTPDYATLPPEAQGRLATIAGARTSLCSDAQGPGASRHNWRVPSRGQTLHRWSDCVGTKLR